MTTSDPKRGEIWLVNFDPTADAFQVKSVSTKRFIEKKGAVSAATLTEVISALALSVDM